MVSEDSAAIRDSVASNADWQFSSIELRSASDESDTSAAAEEEPIRTSSSPNAVSGFAPRPLILLLAEDNPPDALLVRQAIEMEELPLEIHLAKDGERAVEFLVKAEKDPAAPKPHLMLLDLNLPKIDGLEVLRRIRASDKFKDIPVLVVTSSDSPNDRAGAAKLGASYFRKPTTYEEFLESRVCTSAISEHKRAALNRPPTLPPNPHVAFGLFGDVCEIRPQRFKAQAVLRTDSRR